MSARSNSPWCFAHQGQGEEKHFSLVSMYVQCIIMAITGILYVNIQQLNLKPKITVEAKSSSLNLNPGHCVMFLDRTVYSDLHCRSPPRCINR